MVFIKIMLAFVFSILQLVPNLSATSIQFWCGQTLHPTQCLHHLSAINNNHTHSRYIPKDLLIRYEILEKLEYAAWDMCNHPSHKLTTLGNKARSQKEKAALSYCFMLYSDAAQIIRRCFDNKFITRTRTYEDIQIWVSAALTNLDTCIKGFQDFGIEDYEYIFPPLTNNVTSLLISCLELNMGNLGKSSIIKEGFPDWVKLREKKLLRAAVSWANAVVAKDGSGNFLTVSKAVADAMTRSWRGDYVIYVKKGVYKENLEITMNNLMLVGDGVGKTIITGSKYVPSGITTYNTATVGIKGIGFYARGITFRNTAGPHNHQAVALRSSSDLSVFYQCSFEGFQDTLYVHSHRQFYRECYIYGTVDFIFGNAAVVLQNCTISARYPLKLTNTITADGRKYSNDTNTGIVIHNSRVVAASDLKPSQKSVRTYLGRPGGEYSRTVFLNTFLDNLIDPAEWIPWNESNFALSTVYYGEYENYGPGSSTTNRVPWRGYHAIESKTEVMKFAPGQFINTNMWLPATHVPFTSVL